MKTWHRLSKWQKYCLLASIPTYMVAALVGFVPLAPYLSKLLELVLEGLGSAFFVIGFLGFLEIYGTVVPPNTGTAAASGAATTPTESTGAAALSSTSHDTVAVAHPQPQEALQATSQTSDHQRVER